MCQHCVEKGRYTQDQYDQRILNGDLSVLPLMDLTEQQAYETVGRIAREAISRGMPLEDALDIGSIIMVEYYAATGQKPTD